MLNDRSPWGYPPAPKPISPYAAWILSALNVCFKIMSMPFLNRLIYALKTARRPGVNPGRRSRFAFSVRVSRSGWSLRSLALGALRLFSAG